MPNNYVLLERIELNASAASVTFANIPQTGYTDLKIVISGRTNRSLEVDGLNISFNTGGTYSGRRIYGAGSGTPGSDTTYAGMPFMTAATATTNTFGNAEIYVPNYLGSTAKSFSIDGVGENNATTTYMGLGAGLWSGTAAITQITIAPETGTAILSGSTFSLYALAALGTTPAIAPKASGGNIIDFDGTYWIHTFLSSGTFTPQVALSCDYLVVAGGGGGGANYGGGGGGGGAKTSTTSLLSSTNYSVTIGGGGAAVAASAGGNGSPSSAFSISTTGGGGGAVSDNANAGNTGGSGGGGAGFFGGAGGSGTSGEGQNGGAGRGSSVKAAGGGGGKVGTGGAASAGVAGSGGAGIEFPSSSGVFYAGGGGGGADGSGGGTAAGAGGNGGGGAGGFGTFPTSVNGTAGTVNRGGGGGGPAQVGTAGAGGSGIVIIRYLAV
jgi:hypothetical protein